MPLYEYQCKKCRHRFEKIQLFSARPIKKCPLCGGAVEKLLSAPAVQFKGTGWYVTDYARKGSSQGSSSSDGGDGGSKSAESTTTEAKSGDKSDSSSNKSEQNVKSESKESKQKAESSSASKKSHKK